MKTSTVLASLFFGSFAVAAPVDKRGHAVTHTKVVTETVVVYTTVYDDDVASATATSEGLFYEQPKVTSSSVVASSSAAASSAQATSTSVYVAPTPAAETPVVTPSPVAEQPTEAAQPTTTEAAAAPVVESSAAPAPAAATSAAVVAQPQAQTKPAADTSSTTTGQTYSGDITIYDNTGAYGACGTQLYDTDMIVALSHETWGASTYDVMTGAATNPWCGQKIQIQYNGNTVDATIMDMCPGCSGADIDLSVATWKAVTGSDVKTRYKATWSKAS